MKCYKLSFRDKGENKTVFLATDDLCGDAVESDARKKGGLSPDAKLTLVVTLTPSSDAEYLKDPGACPLCHSEDIEGHDINVDGNEAWQEVVCLRCGYQWHDIYELKSYLGRDGVEPIGKPVPEATH